jgi:uncharacterized SAM-binding protein YcdF (DUF218 family)
LPGLPPPRPLRQQKPARRRRRRHAPVRRPVPKRRRNAILAATVGIVLLVAWAALAREFARTSNSNLARFDAIIVLGSPADSDGNPTPQQLARVTEGVREYMRGVAPRLILTGGAAHNHFVEAEAMARIAESEGIPESAIFLEPHAMDTIQNACFSTRIMQTHNWRSAEVVSSAYHLPRAAMIFNRLPIKWRMHVAPPLAPESGFSSAITNTGETLKTVRYLIYADWAERCRP